MKKFQFECNYDVMSAIEEKIKSEGFVEECEMAYDGSELTVGKSLLAFYGAMIRAALGEEICDKSLSGLSDDESEKVMNEAIEKLVETLGAEAFVKIPVDEE